MIKTDICELLNIEYPIFQGGMAWIADASLASAVSNAGGLGIIAAGNANAEYVGAEIDKAKELTNKPFGVNIMLMSPFADEIAKLVVEKKVPVITTGAGNPSKYMEMWKAAGIKVIPVVPSTGIAKLVEKNGATAVIAEGGESGGHIGELTTICLVPQVCDAVSIPVIAAGGIADGRGVAAAFMLGAHGVQLGTRFLVAKECTVHPNYKNKILKAKDIDTITTGKRLGHPVRSLKNPFSREYFKKEYDSSISDEELEALGRGALRLAAKEGDEKNGCFLAGQIAAMVNKEQTAEEIIKEIFAEAECVLGGANKCIKK
jgi:enoyl-[acyl-carrier protein] reductase II